MRHQAPVTIAMVPLKRFGVAFAIGGGAGNSSCLPVRRSTPLNSEATPRLRSMHAVQIRRTSLCRWP